MLHAFSPRRSPQSPSSRTARQQGVTLLELLVVLAIIGILAAIGSYALFQLNRRLSLEAAASEFSQNIQRSRAQALAKGKPWRLRLVSASTYVLEEQDGAGWSTRQSVTLPASMHLASPEAGGSVTFDTRGFANFVPTGFVAMLADDNKTLSVLPSMSGLSRIR